MPLVRIEDKYRDIRLSYGGWSFSKFPSFSGGWGASSAGKGAAVTFTFRGTNVTWKTVKSPLTGKTDVYLDGTKVKTFDGYAPSEQFDVTGYRKTGLQDKRHTLKLVNTGMKNSNSAGTFTDIDRFVVEGRSFEQNSSSIAYGSWRQVVNAKASQGTYQIGSSTTAPLIFGPIYGPVFNLVTATGPDFGTALVEVYRRFARGSAEHDGRFVKRVLFNLRSTTTRWQAVRSVIGLDPSETHQYMVTIASYDGRPVVFDAIDIQNKYSAVGDFSATQNPSGAWSYGYRAPGGSSFTLYTKHDNPVTGIDRWSRPEANEPMVAYNGTGQTVSFLSIKHPPDVLNVHPGALGQKSVVRWTAPSSGTVQIEGRFEGIDTDTSVGGTTTDVAVVHNSATSATTLFSANVNGFGATAPFSISRSVVTGDTIDFSVGYGSNRTYGNDSTGLSATINLT